MRLEIPFTRELTEELEAFWHRIFDSEPDLPAGVFLGDEVEHNRGVLFMTRENEAVAGTCMVNTSKRLPALGGFGEVSTAPELRRRGIASDLCGQAVADFRTAGGQALFLGTGNPEAARVYHRLGWRKLAGANVMANVTGGDSPEAFLVEHFRDVGAASVRTATPEVRIPMIPLLVAPHDWQVLDANARMYSTRYAVQHSCMGLYRRYHAITRAGQATWLAAYTDDGRAVGLSTARLDGSGGCQVDGFTHGRYADAWESLIRAALDWGASHGGSRCWAAVSVEDEEKRALFERLGFREAGAAEGFDLDGRTVSAVRTELPVS